MTHAELILAALSTGPADKKALHRATGIAPGSLDAAIDAASEIDHRLYQAPCHRADAKRRDARRVVVTVYALDCGGMA